MADRAIQLMQEESVTNGVWFALLSRAFPFPQYIIAPEHWSHDTRRGDLFILRVDDGSYKPIFAFEGKSVDAKGSFESNAPQIRGYMKDIIKGGTRGYGFGVLAVGPKYAILQHDGSNTYRRKESIVQDGGIISGIVSSLDPGDLNNDNLADVTAILVSIEGWIRRNVN